MMGRRRASGRSDVIDISCEIRHTTASAVLVFDGAREVWLPLSQVEIARGGDGCDTVILPEWLATEKDLI